MLVHKENLKVKMSRLIEEYNIKAAIFDLDGTLIDNNSFHLQTWLKYTANMGKKITPEEFNAHINGRTNEDAIQYIYGRKMSKSESQKHTLEKEALYREIYKPFIKPVSGLFEILAYFKIKNIPMAIATSGIQPNIDFMFEQIPIKKYFKAVVNSSHITKGKPDPEIYYKTASILNIAPHYCLVFEDSVPGIEAAKAAGMKVIALATTQPKAELTAAAFIIDNFEME